MANTGNKIYAKLVKVINDGTDRPLDDNGDLCSISGLPQAIKDNNISDPNYIAPFQDLTACPISGATAVNCELSAWSEWSTCSAGTQTRTRTVITPASNGGMACGPLSETTSCEETFFRTVYATGEGLAPNSDASYAGADERIYIQAATLENIQVGMYCFTTADFQGSSFNGDDKTYKIANSLYGNERWISCTINSSGAITFVGFPHL